MYIDFDAHPILETEFDWKLCALYSSKYGIRIYLIKYSFFRKSYNVFQFSRRAFVNGSACQVWHRFRRFLTPALHNQKGPCNKNKNGHRLDFTRKANKDVGDDIMRNICRCKYGSESRNLTLK